MTSVTAAALIEHRGVTKQFPVRRAACHAGRHRPDRVVGGNTGLGFLLVFGEGAGNTAMVFVSIILLTIIGILAYGAVVFMERRVLHYMPKSAV